MAKNPVASSALKVMLAVLEKLGFKPKHVVSIFKNGAAMVVRNIDTETPTFDFRSTFDGEWPGYFLFVDAESKHKVVVMSQDHPEPKVLN